MSSPNQRALRRLIALAMLSGVVIIALFCVVEQAQIRSRAIATLEDFAADPRTEEERLEAGHVRPTIAAFSLAEENAPFSSLERGLRARVQEEPPHLGVITHYAEDREQAYFLLLPAAALGLDDEDTFLFYTDVSFASDIVTSAAMIMALVFLAVAAALYLAGRATIRLLDRKDESMRHFFANASHELKTPLMAIQSYADGLSCGLVEPQTACDVIDRESARMDHLIGGILAFSKLDSGMLALQRSACDAREVLYDALDAVSAQAGQRNLHLVPELPEPLTLTADEGLLYSIFSNILSNSVRYAKTTIRLTASREGDTLVLQIANDGPPLEEEDAVHLFDRFYKGRQGQTGIGLALAREYARLHGGDLSAANKDGWVVFYVRLPLD